MTKFLLILFSVLLCACVPNKIVKLEPAKPNEYYANDMRFIVALNTWLEFEHDTTDGIKFILGAYPKRDIEQIHIKSATLLIKEANIEVTKENIISNRQSESEYEDGLYVSFASEFTREEIINSLPEGMDLDDLFDMFKKIKVVEIRTVFAYIVNEEHIEAEVTFKYDAYRHTFVMVTA